MKTKILIHGCYGFLGDSDLTNGPIDICEDIAIILKLSYNGTPEGYQSAYMNAIDDLRNQMFNHLVEKFRGSLVAIAEDFDFDATEGTKLFSEIMLRQTLLASADAKSKTLGGIPGRFRWLQIVKQWDEEQ